MYILYKNTPYPGITKNCTTSQPNSIPFHAIPCITKTYRKSQTDQKTIHSHTEKEQEDNHRTPIILPIHTQKHLNLCIYSRYPVISGYFQAFSVLSRTENRAKTLAYTHRMQYPYSIRIPYIRHTK